MPDTYRNGRRIPELEGRFRGGVTVVVHTPAEIGGLLALASAARALPGDPLATVHRTLTARDVSLPEWPGWVRASRPPTDREGKRSLAEGEGWLPEGEPDRPIDTLCASLELAREVWSGQDPDDARELALAMALPRPGKRRVRIESGRPALVFDHGSLRARVLGAGRSLRRFAVALFPVARSRRQANLVEALRERALGRNALPLPRLDAPVDLGGQEALLVFVHGLVSTDAGTFDGLLRRLGQDPAFRRVKMVGWPHDSLARIRDNAADLAKLLQRTAAAGLPIGFVCHSRGGLVARACAARLIKADGAWRDRLRGAVTFGTPHEGAELAEMGDAFLGKVLLLSTVARGGRSVPILDALWTVRGRRRLPGITDLRPRQGGGRFLRRLEERELRLTRRAGVPALPLLAIGGQADRRGFAAWVSNRLLAGVAHDLVVPLSSSAPASFERTAHVVSDHFSYFEPGAQASLDDAVSFLRAALLPAPPAMPANPPAKARGRRDITV